MRSGWPPRSSLAAALLGAGAAVAIVATGSARGLLAAILWLITLGGSPPLG